MPWWWAALGLAAAGVAVSAYLVVSAARGLPPVCLVGACAEVATSPYASFMGLPTAAWGLALYLIVGAVALAGALGRFDAAWLVTALFGLAVFGATFSVYLIWLQVAVLGAVCAWCAVSAALWPVLVGVAFVLTRRAG